MKTFSIFNQSICKQKNQVSSFYFLSPQLQTWKSSFLHFLLTKWCRENTELRNNKLVKRSSQNVFLRYICTNILYPGSWSQRLKKALLILISVLYHIASKLSPHIMDHYSPLTTKQFKSKAIHLRGEHVSIPL